MHYVIIGGGVAGTTAAQELRKLDPDSEITLVSEEQHPLYSRVLLPHYLKEKVPRERVFLKKEAWYFEQNIEWMRGVVCTHLDARNKFVGLSNGRELPYDKVLITTGGEVRPIDHDLRGVTYFRTLDDTDYILQLVNERNPKSRAGVYGAGFIACEFLNYFAFAGIPTILACRSEHFWTSILNKEAGALIHKHLEDRGVELHVNAEIKDLLGDKELEGFVTSKGEHACSILGVGIGIVPDFSWLKEAGVEVGVGVRANQYLETNVPDVYTAGDVAEFFDVVVERHLIIGNWMNAMSQGRVVAKTMVGDKTSFELVSSYATNAIELEMIFVGDVEKSVADEIHVLGSVESGGITQIHERDGRVVGGVMIGRNTDRKAITSGIKEKAKASEVLGNINKQS